MCFDKSVYHATHLWNPFGKSSVCHFFIRKIVSRKRIRPIVNSVKCVPQPQRLNLSSSLPRISAFSNPILNLCIPRLVSFASLLFKCSSYLSPNSFFVMSPRASVIDVKVNKMGRSCQLFAFCGEEMKGESALV